jgi:hypothetical protein
VAMTAEVTAAIAPATVVAHAGVRAVAESR